MCVGHGERSSLRQSRDRWPLPCMAGRPDGRESTCRYCTRWMCRVFPGTAVARAVEEFTARATSSGATLRKPPAPSIRKSWISVSSASLATARHRGRSPHRRGLAGHPNSGSKPGASSTTPAVFLQSVVIQRSQQFVAARGNRDIDSALGRDCVGTARPGLALGMRFDPKAGSSTSESWSSRSSSPGKPRSNPKSPMFAWSRMGTARACSWTNFPHDARRTRAR